MPSQAILIASFEYFKDFFHKYVAPGQSVLRLY
jgi:hypothetical protein